MLGVATLLAADAAAASARAAMAAPAPATTGFPRAAPTWEAVDAVALIDCRVFTSLFRPVASTLPGPTAWQDVRARRRRAGIPCFMMGRIITTGTYGSSDFTRRFRREIPRSDDSERRPLSWISGSPDRPPSSDRS